jgi:hypothetical protein
VRGEQLRLARAVEDEVRIRGQQRRQLVGKPVRISRNVLHAVHQRAVGPQSQLCLHALERHQLAHVHGALRRRAASGASASGFGRGSVLRARCARARRASYGGVSLAGSRLMTAAGRPAAAAPAGCQRTHAGKQHVAVFVAARCGWRTAERQVVVHAVAEGRLARARRANHQLAERHRGAAARRPRLPLAHALRCACCRKRHSSRCSALWRGAHARSAQRGTRAGRALCEGVIFTFHQRG